MSSESISQEKRERLIREVLDHASSGNLAPFIENILTGTLEVDQMDSRGYTAIHLAVWIQDQESVLKLLDKASCPIDLQSGAGQTPLMMAIIKGNLQLIKLFLDRGADIESKDSLGITPLISAVQSGQISAFYVLLHRGAKIDAKDRNDCGVVHWAAYRNHVSVLRVLKKMGVDLYAIDASKMNALHRAALSNALDSIEFLMFEGFSNDVLDAKGRTPLDIAKENNSDGAIRVLSEYSPRGLAIHRYFPYFFLIFWIGTYTAYYTSILPYTVQYLLPSLVFNFCFLWLLPLLV